MGFRAFAFRSLLQNIRSFFCNDSKSLLFDSCWEAQLNIAFGIMLQKQLQLGTNKGYLPSNDGQWFLFRGILKDVCLFFFFSSSEKRFRKQILAQDSFSVHAMQSRQHHLESGIDP